MILLKLTKLVVRRILGVFRDAAKLTPLARQATRKPAVVGHILATAYRAQITLIVSLALLIFVAPPVVNFFTGTIFPPDTSKKVFGLITTQEANPLKAIFDSVITVILWLTAILSTLVLAWRNIPDGMVRANIRSGKLLAAGDDSTEVTRRRKLYARALALATDEALESEAGDRLKQTVLSNNDTSLGVSITHATISNLSPDEASTAAPISEPNFDERYRLETELGKGAMGVVYRAWDTVLDRQVAVKQLSLILSSDEEYASRFRREARALARLAHPNVVQVYDLIERGSRLWMVLEHVDGGDLATYLKSQGPLSVSEAVKMMIPIAEGLVYAHEQGIIHRDLKPANILLTNSRIPKISDFGIARLSQSGNLTQVGVVMGSPPYMSPEQCSGDETDARTDIYALGITLYELLSGDVPFRGDTSSVLRRHIIEEPRPLSAIVETVTPGIEQLVQCMLAKNPDDRPSDMREVIHLLSQLDQRISTPEEIPAGKSPV